MARLGRLARCRRRLHRHCPQGNLGGVQHVVDPDVDRDAVVGCVPLLPLGLLPQRTLQGSRQGAAGETRNEPTRAGVSGARRLKRRPCGFDHLPEGSGVMNRQPEAKLAVHVDAGGFRPRMKRLYDRSCCMSAALMRWIQSARYWRFFSLRPR